MSEIRVWGVAGSGGLLISGATENDAVPVLYPSISHDGTTIALWDHKYDGLKKVAEEPFGDFKRKGGAVVETSQTMLQVIEYLMGQRGL